MKILVRFKDDNNFGNTMLSFGDLLTKGSRGWTDKWLTKANIVRWFNTIAPILFEMVQDKDRYQGIDTIQTYLQIEESDVFLGAEVDAKMETYHQWGNYDSVLIELGDREKEYPKPSVTMV